MTPVIPCGALACDASAAIEQHFALVGFARYVKALALVASEGKQGRVALSWEAWAVALAAQPEALSEFFNYCQEHGVFTVEDDGEQVALGCPALAQVASDEAAPVAKASPLLFTHSDEWVAWFKEEMAYPPKIANRAENVRVFRRWCASNVTVEEMNTAVQLTIKAGTGLGTPALHGHLQALRAQRIKEANEW